MSFDNQNPYRSSFTGPSSQAVDSIDYAKRKLTPPGISLLVIGIIGLVCMGIYSVLTVVGFAAGGVEPPPNMPKEQAIGFYVGAYGVMAIFGLNTIFQLVVIAGGIAMLRVRSKLTAIIACILCLIPCLSSSCMIFGLPFGIWGLIVLNDPAVTRQMQR